MRLFRQHQYRHLPRPHIQSFLSLSLIETTSALFARISYKLIICDCSFFLGLLLNVDFRLDVALMKVCWNIVIGYS